MATRSRQSPGTQCAVGWPGATLGANVTEVQAWQESRQKPARIHALPDSFTALTQSLKVTAAMTSWAPLVWHVTVVGGVECSGTQSQEVPCFKLWQVWPALGPQSRDI